MINKKYTSGIISFCFASILSVNFICNDSFQKTSFATGEEKPTSGSCGDNAVWKYDGNGLLTISGTGKIEDTMFSYADWCNYDYEINKIVIEKGITSIGVTAFSGSVDATEIIIPDTVTSIDKFAFSGCPSLVELNIPASVTEIANYIFSQNNNLKNVFVDDNNPNYCDIDGCLFTKDLSVMMYYPSAKQEEIYEIPQGTTSLYGTFCDNEYLKSVKIPDSIKSIGQEAFYNTKITSIVIPENVEYIGDGAFHLCSELKEITIENSDCEIFDKSNTICNSSKAIGRDENNELIFEAEYSGVIKGYADSSAQDYAEKYGYNFVMLNEESESRLGDVNKDGTINASDSSVILTAYALISTGDSSMNTKEFIESADINKDKVVDAVDASAILQYYAYVSTGGMDSIEDYFNTTSQKSDRQSDF